MDKKNQILEVSRHNVGELRLGDKGFRSIKCFVSLFEFEFTNKYINITKRGFLTDLRSFMDESHLETREKKSMRAPLGLMLLNYLLYH